MIPFTVKVPVRSEVVFPMGALCMGVESATDFELRGKVDDDQARDKDSGQRIWVVTVVDLEPAEETMRFRRSTEMKVRVVADVPPVAPRSRVAGYPPVVSFVGMTLTPYVDSSRCHGDAGLCRARQAFSLRASGLVEFTAGADGHAG